MLKRFIRWIISIFKPHKNNKEPLKLFIPSGKGNKGLKFKVALYGLAVFLNSASAFLLLHESKGNKLILKLFSLKYFSIYIISLTLIILFSSFTIFQFRGKHFLPFILIILFINIPELSLRGYLLLLHKEHKLRLKENIGIYRPTTFKSFEIIPNSISLDRIRHNNFGFRGKNITFKKQPDSIRLIFMGGSTTYESGVEGGDKIFTEILEEKLSQFFHTKKTFEIINAGVPTWSSVHSLINFATYLLDFKPDIIFLMDGLNDAAVRISDNSRNDYAEYYKPMQITPPKFWESSAFLSTLLRKYTSPANRWWPNYWHGLVDVTNDPKIAKWLQSQYPHLNEMTEGNMNVNSTYPVERNILSLIGVARQFNIRIVLLTTPVLNISHSKVIEALLENHLILKNIAEKENIPLIDLYNLIPQREELYADIYHLNGKGQPIKAEKLFKEIISKKILDMADF